MSSGSVGGVARRVGGAVVVFLIILTSAHVGQVAARQAITTVMHLVDMPVAVAADQPFTVTVAIAGDVPTDGELVVSAYPPVTSRAQVAAIANGQAPANAVSSVSIPSRLVPRDDSGNFAVTVPTQSATRVRDKLRLKDAGLYPVSIEVRNLASGAVVSRLATFIERLGDQPASAVSVGWLFTVNSAPTLQSDGTTLVPDQARADIATLAGFLEGTTTPISMLIRPELLDGLKRDGTPDDLALLTRLRTAIGDHHELLAEPSISIDPSAAVGANMQQTFTDQLRLGEDQLSSSLGANIAVRSSWYAANGIDTAGLGLLRGLGIQHVLLGQSSASAASVASTGSSSGQLGSVAIAADQSIPVLLDDATIEGELRTTTDDRVLRAHQILADLTAMGIERDQQLPNNPRAPGRGVIVAAGSVGDIDPALLEEVFTVLGQSQRVALRTVDGVLGELDRNTSTSAMRPVQVANPTPIDLHDVATGTYLLNADINSYSSMFAGDDPRPDEWRRLMEVYPADNITPTQRNDFGTALEHDFKELRDAVSSPPLGHITIGGRHSNIPFTLDNNSGIALKVLLRMSSAKLVFPQGDQVKEIEGRQSFDIPVQARSGAEFPVTVQLFTPDGRVRLGDPTTLTVRASVLTGLGQVFTGALLVILASWWLQNAMRSRRRRRVAATAVAAVRHPLNGDGRQRADPSGASDTPTTETPTTEPAATEPAATETRASDTPTAETPTTASPSAAPLVVAGDDDVYDDELATVDGELIRAPSDNLPDS